MKNAGCHDGRLILTELVSVWNEWPMKTVVFRTTQDSMR